MRAGIGITEGRLPPGKVAMSRGRLIVSIVMAIPAAMLLGILVAFGVDSRMLGGSVLFWAPIVCVPVLAFLFYRGARHVRGSFRRGLLAIGLESFLFPLVEILFAIIVSGSTGFASIIIGLVMALAIGIPCIIAYFMLRSDTWAKP